MINMQREKSGIDPVQLIYARVLDLASHLGMALIAIGYLVYVLQLLPLSVPIDAVAGNWHLRASVVQQKLHMPAGWSFMEAGGTLLKGDVISYLSIIYLAMATILCLAFSSMTFFREKNYIYTVIALLQVAVLLFASSGVVGR